MDFPETEASLIVKQARSELLDRVTSFCCLERSDAEDQNEVLGMQNPVYHALTRAAINLSLPCHSSAVEIADRNFNIKLSERTSSLNPAKPWGPRDFFSGIGYHTRNLEGLNPESLVLPGLLQQNEQWRISPFI